ncbi:hypothetical protein BDR07DRAFT_1419304 [Suillus spraguei]|nr:hypothetical protein BDR07DRAFT_1419304 [Suillus spraguei]
MNSRKDVVRHLLSKMIVFLAYILPCSTLSLLTIMQAQIPGQEQHGYDADPKFFHGMHQVRATSFLISYIVHSSILKFPE